MKIKSLKLIEDQIINKDYFSPRRNLIHSASNTKGKTTYVRMLFYALGYKMPEPKGVKFNNIKTKIEFEEKNIDYVVTRDKNILTLKSKNRTMTYVLPMGHEDFLSYIFDYKKLSVLRNLLGIIYIDQEKGWTLLNRGVVVGRIKFSIEDLLAGLNNVDVNSLTERKLILENRKKKCEALLDLNKLKEEVFEENGEILISDIEKELNNNISLCNIKISEKKRSLNQINSVIEENKKFYDYIDSMNLSVQKDEVVIDVNRSNLVNAPQANDYLLARRNMIMFDIEKIKKEKSVFEA